MCFLCLCVSVDPFYVQSCGPQSSSQTYDSSLIGLSCPSFFFHSIPFILNGAYGL